MDPAAIATALLKHKDSMHNPFAALSLCPGMPPVTHETPIHDARRNYMKLAALIHPDRLGATGFPQATEAFQVLVKVFEAAANPNVRKAFAAGGHHGSSSSPAGGKKKKTETVARKRAANKKNKAAQAKSATLVDDDDVEFEDGDPLASDSDDDDIHIDQLQAPEFSEVPERSNTGCFRTTVCCPNCRTKWVPDSNQLYVLFMHFGVPTHCETCLMKYGPNTGIHLTPCCGKEYEYDPSVYNKKVKCPHPKCSNKPPFGFCWFRLPLKVIEEVMHAEFLKDEARRKQRERDDRMAARSNAAGAGCVDGGGANGGISEEKLLALIGQCMVDEQCPICSKAVKSKHRAHVTECQKNPPPPKKRRGPALAAIVDDKTGRVISDKKKKKKAAPKKKASGDAKQKKLATKKTTAKKKKTVVVRRRASSVSSSSSDDYSSSSSDYSSDDSY